MSRFGKELLESAAEALAIAEGKLKPARVAEMIGELLLARSLTFPVSGSEWKLPHRPRSRSCRQGLSPRTASSSRRH